MFAASLLKPFKLLFDISMEPFNTSSAEAASHSWTGCKQDSLIEKFRPSFERIADELSQLEGTDIRCKFNAFQNGVFLQDLFGRKFALVHVIADRIIPSLVIIAVTTDSDGKSRPFFKTLESDTIHVHFFQF